MRNAISPNPNPTHVFCRPYIKMIDIIFRFIASHRAGNWELSLTTCRRLLLLLVTLLLLFAPTVPKGNEQPGDHSTISI